MALLGYGLAALALVLTVLLARTGLTLGWDDGGRLVLAHRGLLRRTTLALGPGYQVTIVEGASRRAVIVDPEGRTALVLDDFMEFWARDDVVALLECEGIEISRRGRRARTGEPAALDPAASSGDGAVELWRRGSPAA